MSLEIEATYEGGVLRPTKQLPLAEGLKVKLIIHPPETVAPQGHQLIHWTGSLNDLDYLINDPENDPLEPS